MPSKSLCIAVPCADRSKGSATFLSNLLSSIEGETQKNCEVAVLFDAVKPRFLDEALEKFPWIIAHVNDGLKNNRYNFSKNSNIGLRFAHKELNLPCLLVNQDTVLPTWEHLKKIPGKGLATPYTSEDWKAAANTGARTPLTNKFAFFCPFFSLNLLENVGMLDPGLKSTHSDDDMVARCLLKGIPVEQVDVAIYHKGSHIDQAALGGSLSGAYNNDDLDTFMKRYRAKWQIPANITHDQAIPYILSAHNWHPEMRIN